ncbi:hypothetical protein PENTCL1PPCAC_23796, partial [Pristionchus entomophagus]
IDFRRLSCPQSTDSFTPWKKDYYYSHTHPTEEITIRALMSASSVHSLASTQDDDVASIEWGVITAASYTTEDESRLLNLSAITPPVAYEDDDISEMATASPHPAPHHDDEDDEEEEETVEVARRDATATRGIGQEFTARVQELLLLHESAATIKAERAAVSDGAEEKEEEEQATRVDSEEAGVATALEIDAPDAPPSASASARVPLPATPRRPDTRGSAASGGSGRAGSGSGAIRYLPQPPTPRPSGATRMRLPGLSALAAGPQVHPHHPPFFPPHRSMYGGFNPGPFGPLGYGGPSMRPFNSLPLPPHLAPGGGLGRPSLQHHMGGAPLPPPLPPRAYMGGGPPASLGGPLGARGSRPHYYPGQHHPLPAHALASSPFPHHLPHSFSPPTSSPRGMEGGGAERRTASSTPRRDSETSPRSSASAALSTISASPRTAPASLERSHYGGRMAQSVSSASASHRDSSSSSSSPPTMAALGIGQAGAEAVGGAAAAAAAASELTPYPLVYCTPAGSISCVLNHDVLVEMAVDRSVRIVLHDHFAAFCNARGNSSAILHPTARIRHTEDYVYTKFIANNEKMAVFGEQGVLFTMSHLSEAYLVNSAAYPGASAVALDQLQFPALDDDFTIKMFYKEAQTGPQFHALCRDIVSEATYDRRPDGSLYLHINGMLIRQSTTGDVIIDARPRQISCSPSKKSVHVRSGCIDMAVEEDERGYVKQAHKRVHVSRSGMVISDGNCITSMDHFGRIVCCN